MKENRKQTADALRRETLSRSSSIVHLAGLKYRLTVTRYGNNDARTIAAADSVCKIAVFSVLNTVIDPQRRTAIYKDAPTATGCDPVLTALKRTLSRDLYALELTRQASSDGNGTATAYNDNGDAVTVVTDSGRLKEYTAALDRFFTGETLSDGMDLYQTAYAALLDETKKQVDRGDGVDLEKPYTVRRLKSRVYIRRPDSVGGFETVHETPIQAIYKSVRRYITDSRSVYNDPRCKYVYLDDELTDDRTGERYTVYRRLMKYCQAVDLDAHIDRNGNATTAATVTAATVETYDRLIEMLSLSPRETRVLNLRLQGYGKKAIATYTGTTDNAVKMTLRRIREKALEIGLDPDNE